MTIMKLQNQRAVALTLFFAFALSGCGGGGGSSGGSTPAGPSLENTFVGNVNPANRAGATRSANTAASATPLRGSVTQSSNVDSSNVTQDQLSATASYSGNTLSVSVTNEVSGSWGTVSSGDVALRANNLMDTGSGNTYRERMIGKRIGTNGFVVVDTVTDRLSAADTDYLVGGVWLYVPDEATPTPVIGAFLDGPDTNLTPAAYLTAEKADATYEGDATGLYLGTDGEETFFGEFVADVELTLDFGTSPTVSGMVSNVNEIDFARDVRTPIAGNPTLTLGPASVANAAPGGFFSGDTSGSDTSGIRYTGKWGGQFYGDEAQKVGGTFGGRSDTNADGVSFVGTFGAQKR